MPVFCLPLHFAVEWANQIKIVSCCNALWSLLAQKRPASRANQCLQLVVRFQVLLAPAGTTPERATAREMQIARYRRAFVSYSSQDRAEVLRRVQAFTIAGMSVFQDILHLDPGERWEKALYREIDKCDVFLLFWSQAAAASPWIAKEIDYALARRGDSSENPPAIQPVPIEGPPIVPAPLQLSDLHFNDALLAHIAAAAPRAGSKAV
jgi:hypothetical protein